MPRGSRYHAGMAASPDEDPFGFCMGPDAAFDGSMCKAQQQHSAIAMTFAGNGKGEYIQETTYRFVGDGVGEYGVEPASFCAQWGTFIGLSVVMMVLLALVLASFGIPAEASSDGIPFDCEVDYANWDEKWSVDQQRWCCHQLSRACESGERPSAREAASSLLPLAAVQPYDCHPEPDWNSTWTKGQKAWCCKHNGLGCQPLPTQHPPPRSHLRTSTSQPGIVTATQGGSAGWAAARQPAEAPDGDRSQTQEFSQAAELVTSQIQSVPEVADSSAMPLPTQSRMRFNCSSAPEVWSFTKQLWCCQHTGKGCSTASPAAPGVPIASQGPGLGTAAAEPELRS